VRGATVFARARWAAALAVVLAIVAMLLYPGGTLIDRSTRGYSLLHNFLSDLGMTVAYGGESNAVGAMLFVASLGILVLGLGASLFGLVRVFRESDRTRLLALAAVAVGVLVCAAFMGVALTPENRMMALHIRLTLFAFRAFPFVPLLLGVAAARDARFSRQSVVAWVALTVVLVVYVGILGWGPPLTTDRGLVVQVTAQKVVTVSVMIVLIYQTYYTESVVK
jgi:hypothetical protein